MVWIGHEEAIQLSYDAYKDVPDQALTFAGDNDYMAKLKAALA